MATLAAKVSLGQLGNKIGLPHVITSSFISCHLFDLACNSTPECTTRALLFFSSFFSHIRHHRKKGAINERINIMGRDAGFHHGLPLGQPSIRKWKLTWKSTRHDKELAAPSDEDHRIMWTTYSAVLIVISILMMTIFFLAPVKRKIIRRNAFNLYLIYLMIPGMIFSYFWLLDILCLVG